LRCGIPVVSLDCSPFRHIRPCGQMYVVAFALQEVGSPATDNLVTRRELEIALHSELNESRIARSLRESKSR